jgi:hypothetical protein
VYVCNLTADVTEGFVRENLPVAWLYVVVSLIFFAASSWLSKLPLAFYNDYLGSPDILGALEDLQGASVVSEKAELLFSV